MKYVKSSLLGIVMCLSMFKLSALSEGNAAPQFELPDQDNKTRTLTEFKGKYIVLYFYPKDDTPGCTKQACQLRNHFDEFEKNDIVVLGINYDSPKSHKKFKEKHKLPFILLSDQKKKVAKKYGAKNWWFLPIPSRMTFIINADGTIVSILKNVDVGNHAEKVLQIVQAIKNSKQ